MKVNCSLWALKNILRDRGNSSFLKTTKTKLQKENHDFEMNPLFRVQRNCGLSSLTSFSRQPPWPFFVLEISLYLANFVIIDPVCCPLQGVFNTWRADLSSWEFFHLLVFSSSELSFPWLAPFELLWEIFLMPRFKASMIEIMQFLVLAEELSII